MKRKWIISDYGNVEKRMYNKLVNPLWCKHIIWCKDPYAVNKGAWMDVFGHFIDDEEIWCCECGSERPGVILEEIKNEKEK